MRLKQIGNEYRLAFRLISWEHICSYDYRAEKAGEIQPIADYFSSLKYIIGHSFCGDTVYDEKTATALAQLKRKLRGKRDSNRTARNNGNSLFDFFDELKIGTPYMVIHESIDINCTFLNYIQFISPSREELEAMEKKHLGNLGYLLVRYKGLVFGISETRHVEGERKVAERMCRFCGDSVPVASFKHEAHAIPEAVGNTRLFCLEECDLCNSELSAVEEHFVHFMDFRRATNFILKKGSSTPPNIKGMNFGVSDGCIYVDGSKVNQEYLEKGLLKLEHSMMITDQGLYRALCKFVVDLLPSTEISHFRDTIAWIRSLKYASHVPSIYHVYGVKETKQPILWIFLNSNSVADSPYCTALLHVCDAMFLYMVPFVDLDEERFMNDDSLVKHWAAFTKHLPYSWEAWDLSSKESKYPHVFISVGKQERMPLFPEAEAIDVSQYTAPAQVSPRDSVRYLEGREFERSDVLSTSVLSAPRLTINRRKRVMTVQNWEDLTVDYELIELKANPSSGDCRMAFDFTVKDGRKGTFYMRYQFSALFRVDNIANYIEFRKRGTYICRGFLEYIWASTLQMADSYYHSLRQGTPFEPFDFEGITLTRCATAIAFCSVSNDSTKYSWHN